MCNCAGRIARLEAEVATLTGLADRLGREEILADMHRRIELLAATRPTHPERDVDALIQLLSSHGIATHGLCARDAGRRLGWSGERIVRARAEAERAGLIDTSRRRSTGGRPAIVMRAR